MIFSSFDYFLFILVCFVFYWALPKRIQKNAFLVLASYFFCGYVHPWFCVLLVFTTLVSYLASLAIHRFPEQKKIWLVIAVVAIVGDLGVFKYFDFFAENIQMLANAAGFPLDSPTLDILLPLGISFYSFQAIAYNIDVYRGNLAPRGNFIDFALFLSFFPRLVAGPIERGANLLPQIEKEPSWQWQSFSAAWPLLICGYAKKVVIADNIAVYVNKVFALQCPSVFLLMAASLAFTLQIYADFSAYTDIARGSARLFGFELMENFKFPYSAISPSDFWRRWHISFSTWIRDYLYIPMGGSRRNHWWKQFLVLLVVLGLSGLWHGAAWHFIVWGLYYGILIYLYRVTGFGSGWSPCTQLGKLAAWALMFFFIVFGWAIFRAASLSWLVNAISGDAPPMIGEASMVAGLVILIWTSVLAMPFTIFKYLSDNQYADKRTLRVVLAAGLIVLITFFAPELQQDFIYFQF